MAYCFTTIAFVQCKDSGDDVEADDENEPITRLRLISKKRVQVP
jgi:hypothetical protein